MTLDELQILIDAEITPLKQGLSDAMAAIGKTTKSVEKQTKAFSKLKSSIAATFSIAAILGFAKTSMAAYQEQIQNETRLTQVMQLRMGATQDEIKSVIQLTSAYQQLGVVGDEVQLAGLQELGTYVTETDSLKALAGTMNDMLAQQYGFNATQESAQNIATMMGKVLDGQTGALSRYGYAFSEAEEQILKYGSEAERVAVLAKIVGESVGGMNEALGQTPVGRMIQLKNAFGDVIKTFGQGFQNIFTGIAPILNWIVDKLQIIAYWFQAITAVLFGVSATASATAKSMAGVGEAATAAAEEVAAAQKGLAGFDRLNNSSDDSGSGAGVSGGGAIGGLADLGKLDIDTSGLDKATEYINKFKDAWKGVTDYITANKVPILATISGIGAALAVYFGGPALAAILGPAITWVTSFFAAVQNWGLLKTVMAGLSVAFQAINVPLLAIAALVGAVTAAVVQLWNTDSEFKDSLIEAWNNIKTILTSVWETVIKPIFTAIKDAFIMIWDKGLKPLWDQFVQFVKQIILLVTDIWNKAVGPLVNLFVQIFGPAIATIIGNVIKGFGNLVTTGINMFTSLLKGVTDIVEAIRKIFDGLIMFITGVFTGDWSKAWAGVVKIFGGLWDGIVAIFKIPINWIIDGINGFIRDINGIKVPNWVPGVGGLGFSIPELKRLEVGGVVNKPTPALIGENGPEAVVPLKNNTQWITSLANTLARSIGSQSSGSGPLTINLHLPDGTPFMQWIIQQGKTMARQTGMNPFAF